MLQSRLLPTLVTFALAAASPALAEPAAPDGSHGDNMFAALSDGDLARIGREVPIPQILGSSDEATYRKAFEFEVRGQWIAAEKEIAHVRNPLLVGHLLARHILDDAGSAREDEIKSWLRRYTDLPEAQDVYALARKRLGNQFHASGLTPTSRSSDAAIDPEDSRACKHAAVVREPPATLAFMNTVGMCVMKFS